MNDELDGIVIDVRDYREHDALLTILSDTHGEVSMVARGIRKVKSKNAPACQLFTHVRMQLDYRENAKLQSLRSAEIITSYRKIREDLLKQSIASFLCECVYKSKFEYGEDTYSLLKGSLDILQGTTHPFRILCLFQANMNRLHGIVPYVDACVRCGDTSQIYGVSLISGGFVCKECYQIQNDKTLSITDLKYFRLLCKATLANYEVLKTITEFEFCHFDLLYSFFEEYAGVSLKSIRFLRCLMNMEGDLK